LVRAVCNLPLGSPRVVQPCAIANLLGDLWLAPAPAALSVPADVTDSSSRLPATSTLEPRTSNLGPRFDRALAVPGVRLHLYEKIRPRKGRKMGHLSAVASTPEEAVALVLRAKSLL
jgi:5-(carboxyamino)imidazole ribonucleotide synthase